MATTMVITARFPLGVYLGHSADGLPSQFPDTARLHTALVNAAGQGSLAEDIDGALHPSERAVSALRWLEENPPTGLIHPPMMPVAVRSPVLSWRFEGVMESKREPVPRRVAKSQSDGVAVSGIIAWSWGVQVPGTIRDTLDELCADVSCLGEADSPVVLELPDPADWEPTHLLDPDQTGFPAPGGLRVRTPLPGRFDELEADYQAAYPARPPTTAADQHVWTARPGSYTPSAQYLRERVYRTSQERVSEAPWPRLMIFRVRSRTDLADTMGWSVAMHRAIIARLGDDAPALITGRSRRGVPLPANRIGVQIALPHPVRSVYPGETLVVLMLPADASAEDLLVVRRAAEGVQRLYRVGGETRLAAPEAMDAADYWLPPPEGTHRFWRPYPSLVPEVRRLPPRDGRPWTLNDAGALAVGFVFRDLFEEFYESGKNRYRSIAETMINHGVRWHDTHLLHLGSVTNHVHKVPKDLVVQPLTGIVDMQRLISPGTLFALGQSRHLGGGLMIPEDIPEQLARQRGLV